MFATGQLIGLLVMGSLLGLIVQSQGKKKNQAELGNIGLAACVASTFLGSLMGLGWLLGLGTMIGFLVTIHSRK
jgi:hypothetical protein